MLTNDVILGVAVLALLVYRQLRARPLRASGERIVVILAIIGLVEVSDYLQQQHGVLTYAALGGSLVLAAGFGAARAATVRLWLRDTQPWTQGNWVTAGLWVLALAAHLGFDSLVTHGPGESGLGAATIVAYLAVSLGVQRVITQWRAQRLQRAATPVVITDAR